MNTRTAGATAATILLGALAAAAAVHLLWSAWCAFTWLKYQLVDYGLYTNMMWNTGHGSPFRMLVDRTYLGTHLSFTMGLLGIAFHVWDHPFLPALLQGLMLAGGAVVLSAAARRRGLPAVACAALALFYVAHPFTQAAMLSELRGVNLYFLLYPWLFYCLSFAKRWTPLPLALFLATREDSFLLALPLVLYVARRDRWRAGYGYAAFVVAYALLATLVLFPWLGGATLAERRAGGWGERLDLLLGAPPAYLQGHLDRLPWLLLPAALALFRGASPVFVLPSMAYLMNLSMIWFHDGIAGFRHHYGGAALIALTVGLLEAWARRKERPPLSFWHVVRPGGAASAPRPAGAGILWRAWALALLAVGLHVQGGFLPGGGRTDRCYRVTHPDGYALLRAARHVPREGLLVLDRQHAAMFANRGDLLDWGRFDPARHEPRAVFLPAEDLDAVAGGWPGRALAEGRAGVAYYDGKYLALELGRTDAADAFVLAAVRNPGQVIPFGRTPKHHGDDRAVDGAQNARHWHGNGSRAPATISYGGHRRLEAGRHRVLVRYRAVAPERDVRGYWARVSLHRLNEPAALVERDVDHVPLAPGRFGLLELPLDMTEAGPVEIRVTAGDAEVWMDRALFMPAAEPAP